MKRILKISLWSLLLCGLVVTLGFVNAEQKVIPCKAIDITIDRSSENNFIDEEDIRTIIYDKGDKLVGHPLSTLDIQKMEKVIRNNPFVSNAEVYETIDGVVKIEVKQRVPVLRVYNTLDESFYVDETGTYMPTSEKYTSNVVVANGIIDEPFSIRTLKTDGKPDSTYKKTIVDDLFQLAKYIEKDELLKSLIVQVYVNNDGDLELTPRVGNHQVIFGDINNMEEKFKKLIVLYQKGFSKTGWNQYSTVNLKYKGQVVCTRRDAMPVENTTEKEHN